MRSLVAAEGRDDDIRVESAGTAGWHVGEGADSRTVTAARRRGIAMHHRAQQFTAADFARFDHVIALDSSNLRELRAMAPDAATADRVRLLRSFDPGSPPDADVPDPYYGGAEGFDLVLDLCDAACRGLLDTIRP